ncbi:hypothetical protein HYH03_010953 [Edaphochlamys debaryana]|uniref:Uncharacterized protein n=1 Tax=Edaphochlamys debaryana TaxID=47281 RepID=A0A835XVI3_9CHLO|nr:hypothetical protein HYH03_010953 [Edaphochlamys debaryana]|eukprot:KAG2490559.1 hypothetical protein HYH03_010953 [Edaphochlamys debaryana]
MKMNTSTSGISPEDAEVLFDLRRGGTLPPGPCMYIQSGDTSDFDGYLIAAAGHVVQQQTQGFEYVVAVPERRAWRDKEEPDTMRHDPEYSEEVLSTSGTMLRNLCPDAMLVRGALNARNIIPWKMMFNEPEKYGPLLTDLDPVDIRWSSLQQLADRILDPQLTSVVIDMNGSMGYLDKLVELLGPEGEQVLGRKMKAAGLPVIVMAGVSAEVMAQTLPLPGRDPRATKNAIYYPPAVRVLLRLAAAHSLPLLFVTNNVCNKVLKMQDAAEVALKLGLVGLLRRIGDTWFSLPYLLGKCVPFDWVAFAAMLLYGRRPDTMSVGEQELWVGREDPSVLVLRDTSQPESDTTRHNLEGTERFGVVQAVLDVNVGAMLALAQHACSHTAI